MDVLARARNSQVLRLLSIGFLALLLQIPISTIGGLVTERQTRRQDAVEEVTSRWGGVQAITGPALVVPYTPGWVAPAADGAPRVSSSHPRHAIFLPETLRIRGSIDTEVRKRGIFAVPVYALELGLEGEFARPDVAKLGIDPAAVAWQDAHLAIGIGDTRAIQSASSVTWNGAKVAFLPGTGAFADAGVGIHAPVGVPEGAERIRFSFPLSLNGSLGIFISPFGRTTEVELDADFAHPSFQGNWLPVERTISSSAFRASWSIPYLGRNFPQAWRSDAGMRETIEGSRFGVELANPVDQYRMAERSVKYAGLFILLTFATIWLIEVLAGVRVHPIQYLMLGAALCLFYLLELSLSEHLGFPVAYALASTAVIGMVGAYGVAKVGRVRRALVVGTGVALLYAYLYVLLTNEDYALLAGSVGLFAILAAIMYVTRRIDWYAVVTAPVRRTAP